MSRKLVIGIAAAMLLATSVTTIAGCSAVRSESSLLIPATISMGASLTVAEEPVQTVPYEEEKTVSVNPIYKYTEAAETIQLVTA